MQTSLTWPDPLNTPGDGNLILQRSSVNTKCNDGVSRVQCVLVGSAMSPIGVLFKLYLHKCTWFAWQTLANIIHMLVSRLLGWSLNAVVKVCPTVRSPATSNTSQPGCGYPTLYPCSMEPATSLPAAGVGVEGFDAAQAPQRPLPAALASFSWGITAFGHNCAACRLKLQKPTPHKRPHQTTHFIEQFLYHKQAF